VWSALGGRSALCAPRFTVLSIGQVCLKEGEDALAVSISRNLESLVVFGAFHKPEFLWLPSPGKKGAGYFGLNIRVGCAVDHQDRPWGQAGQRVFESGEAAIISPADSP
jgi:hypothetical protein